MRNFLSGLWPIVVGLTIGLIGVNFVASPVTISGDSMQPNLQNNQIVMVNKQGEIKRGEVVVFNAYGVDPNATTPDEKYIKRVIGMPGDTVSDVNGVLRVNGKVVDQSFISENEQVATNNRVGDWTSLAELGQSQNWQGPISVRFQLDTILCWATIVVFQTIQGIGDLCLRTRFLAQFGRHHLIMTRLR